LIESDGIVRRPVPRERERPEEFAGIDP